MLTHVNGNEGAVGLQFSVSKVPRALLPPYPQYPSLLTDTARLLLYMRSHWIRMPPWLLIYHLSYKFYATRIRPTAADRGDS